LPSATRLTAAWERVQRRRRQVIVGWLMGGTILQVYLQYSPHIRDIEVSSGDMTARRLDRLRQSNLLNIVVGPLICAIIPIIVYHIVAVRLGVCCPCALTFFRSSRGPRGPGP